MPKEGPMPSPKPYLAVIADMDGVITRTARLHREAWRSLFDDVLAGRPRTEGEDHSPFTDQDYVRLVDGKPRLDGVRDFLADRGISLPEGDPSDGPDADTVHGLGTRKNDQFLATLTRHGVDTYPDTMAAFDRWQRDHLGLAVVSASRNCRRILDEAGLADRFDAIVDGETAREEGLSGKADLIAAAAARLDVEPSRCVLLEDATSGVRAGREVGCGLIVGVDRRDEVDEAPASPLTDDAHRVVTDVSGLRFPRRLRSIEEQRAAFESTRGGRPLAVFLDFDGTLSPIVDDPDAASIPDSTREAVRELTRSATVAIVSGRDRADVEDRAGLEGIHYAGSHGLDIKGPDRELVQPDAEAAAEDVARVEAMLRDTVGPIEGVVIERKRFSVAVHYRMVADEHVDLVRLETNKALDTTPRLRARTGKKVIELLPAIDWHKGHAVNWLLDALGIDPRQTLVMYVGDDETDEDAFAALAGRGLGIHVGPEVSDTLADYHLPDPAAVEAFLRSLASD
ncbi:trehalose-phosphatase [bacterium]|nr:trehalose-phosphatase [bacterium]